MAFISIGIYDEHNLIGQGIEALLKRNDDFEVKFVLSDKEILLKTLKTYELNILIINFFSLYHPVFEIISYLNINLPKIKILVVSIYNTEEIVLKTIKSGAKGFLDPDSDKNELVKAIYSLRNGYDYFSNSIAHLLLNQYIKTIKLNETNPETGINKLSVREIEILKLWGESLSNQEIADKLFISIRTVESHKNHIMQKLNMKTTVDMVKFAIKNNLIEI